jgi:hypothetical protein
MVTFMEAASRTGAGIGASDRFGTVGVGGPSLHERTPSMSSIDHDPTELSRRGLIAGLGALAGVTAAVTFPSVALAAPHVSGGEQGEALSAAKANLTYLPIDCFAFHPTSYGPTGAGAGRYYDNLTGLGVLQAPGSLRAPLLIPTGSIVRQLNVAYQGQPIISIEKRNMTSPQIPEQLALLSLNAGNGTKTQTIDLDPIIPIAADCTYTVTMFCSAGVTFSGVTVGYEAPGRVFVPFSGAKARVYDSRENNVGKLAPNEERVVNLGLAGARHAVFNLTLDATENAGFVSTFAANIAWPNTSSINWSSTNQIIANSVICNLDPSGQIKIRGGANKTHVIIDMVGYLI